MGLRHQRLKQYRADEIIGQPFWRFYSAEDVDAGKPQQELRVAASEGQCEDEGCEHQERRLSVLGQCRHYRATRREREPARFFEDYKGCDRAEASRRIHTALDSRRGGAAGSRETRRRCLGRAERLRVTLHSIADAVIATDVENCITLLNPVAEELTGWKSAEAVGKPLGEVFQIIDMSTRVTAENPVARVVREGRIVAQSNLRLLVSREQRERPIDDTAAPIKNEHGRMVGAVLVFRDVTEKRAAESAPNQRRTPAPGVGSREDGRLGMEHANEGRVVVGSSQTRFTVSNLARLTVRLRHSRNSVHVDDREAVNQAISRAVDTWSDFDIEFRIMRPDDGIHWLTSKGKLFCDENGQPLRMMGVGTDVTDRKRAEQELRRGRTTVADERAALADHGRDATKPRVDRSAGRSVRLAQ